MTDSGHKSFIYLARFPAIKPGHKPQPTRRWLGDYPTMTLQHARVEARRWDALLAKGIDPRDDRRREKEEAARAKASTSENAFELKVEKYLKFCKRQKQRQIREVERIIAKELMPKWKGRPVGTIAPEEVKGLIEDIAERSPSTARNVLTVCKSLFDHALAERSPAAALRPKKIIGKKQPRQRLMTDDEVRAFWAATERMAYPYGSFYRLLLLTGVRLREAAKARWSEFDVKQKRWVIPPERFKSDCHHIVPLSGKVLGLLKELPIFPGSDLLFTTTGDKPINGFSRPKKVLDQLMTEALGKPPAPWVVHDLRRVVRTKLASLKVPDIVAELALGHGKKGVQRIYDLEERELELREALELWASRLRDITTAPDPSKVRKIA